jgi:hypothetical protein
MCFHGIYVGRDDREDVDSKKELYALLWYLAKVTKAHKDLSGCLFAGDFNSHACRKHPAINMCGFVKLPTDPLPCGDDIDNVLWFDNDGRVRVLGNIVRRRKRSKEDAIVIDHDPLFFTLCVGDGAAHDDGKGQLDTEEEGGSLEGGEQAAAPRTIESQ